jgi:hypothetical protein
VREILLVSRIVLLVIHLAAGRTDRVSSLIRSTEAIHERARAMTPEEHITKMKKAIVQAIKVLGDRFGSTEQDVARAIQELQTSMPASSDPSGSPEPLLPPGSQSPQETHA